MGRGVVLAAAATATTALICGGCATAPATTPGTGAGAAYAPMVDMQGVDPDALAADVVSCRTAASSVRVMHRKGECSDISDAVVLGVGIFVPFGFVGMALVSSIAAEFSEPAKPQAADAALQQKTLVNCMARKGYRNVDPNVSVAYVARPAATPDAFAPAQAGRDTYVAESFAKANFCQGPARAVLQGKGPGFERYAVACDNGQRIALRCEFGNCAPVPAPVTATATATATVPVAWASEP